MSGKDVEGVENKGETPCKNWRESKSLLFVHKQAVPRNARQHHPHVAEGEVMEDIAISITLGAVAIAAAILIVGKELRDELRKKEGK